MRIDLHLLRSPLIVFCFLIVLQSAAFWLFETARREASTVSRQLAWIEKQQDVVNWINRKHNPAAFSRPLDEVVTESARDAGIILPSKVSGSETVKITLTDVEFNRLVRWLLQLQQTFCTVVLQLDLIPAAAGEVNVTRLVLGRQPRMK